MTMGAGYIPISRKLFEHELWSEKRVFNRAEAWIDVLRSVRWEASSKTVLIGNVSVEIGRGEMPVSLRYLAERWMWSKNKVDSFLDYLIKRQMIAKRTAAGTQQTILTVCKFDTYNPASATSGTADGTPPGHRRDTAGTKKNKGNNSTAVPDGTGSTELPEGNSSVREDEIIQPKNKTRARRKTEAVDSQSVNWRSDFETYKSELRTQYAALISDQTFLRQQQGFNPGVDVRKTLEKACVNFWATEAGWKHKKRQKTNKIDWKATLTNAISQPQNKVYEPRTNSISGRKAERKSSLESLERAALNHLFGDKG